MFLCFKACVIFSASFKESGCLTPAYCADFNETDQTTHQTTPKTSSCDKSRDEHYCRNRCDENLCNADKEWGDIPLNDELTTTTTTTTTPITTAPSSSIRAVTLFVLLLLTGYGYLPNMPARYLFSIFSCAVMFLRRMFSIAIVDGIGVMGVINGTNSTMGLGLWD